MLRAGSFNPLSRCLMVISFLSSVWLDMTRSSSRATSRSRAWTRTSRNTTPRGCFTGARPETSRRSSWWVLLPSARTRHSSPALVSTVTDVSCHRAPSEVDRALKHSVMRCLTCHLLYGGPVHRTFLVLIHMPVFKLLSQFNAVMNRMMYFSGQEGNRTRRKRKRSLEKVLNVSYSHFFDLLFRLFAAPPSLSLTDPERGSHDCTERPRGRLHIWGREIGVDRPPELCHAPEGEQLPLPRAEAHRVRGLPRVPEAGVGDASQFPQSLHFTCEYEPPSDTMCGSTTVFCKIKVIFLVDVSIEAESCTSFLVMSRFF